MMLPLPLVVLEQILRDYLNPSVPHSRLLKLSFQLSATSLVYLTFTLREPRPGPSTIYINRWNVILCKFKCGGIDKVGKFSSV